MAKKTYAQNIKENTASIIHARASAETEIVLIVERLERETGLEVKSASYDKDDSPVVNVIFYDEDDLDTNAFDTPAEEDCP